MGTWLPENMWRREINILSRIVHLVGFIYKMLSHTFFFSASEGWVQVSLCVPQLWCISGCVNSMCGGHRSELPSYMNLVPSMVRTVFPCLFFAEYFVLKLAIIHLYSIMWIFRLFFTSAFSCSISHVLLWITANCKYGGFQITTVLHLNVLFMGRLERFWHMWKDINL